MGFYLHIVSPTGERKEKEFIFKLGQVGAFKDSSVPVHWGDVFFYKEGRIIVPLVSEDKKDRELIAEVRLSWITNSTDYLTFLQAMLTICDELGLQLVDGQDAFGVITRDNLEAAVQNLGHACHMLDVMMRLGKTKEPVSVDQLLAIPVTDFELSLRVRNNLRKMGVMTLADLCRCTEQELLASEFISETHLAEIKAMLDSKSLRLGQLPCIRRPDNAADGAADDATG